MNEWYGVIGSSLHGLSGVQASHTVCTLCSAAMAPFSISFAPLIAPWVIAITPPDSWCFSYIWKEDSCRPARRR